MIQDPPKNWECQSTANRCDHIDAAKLPIREVKFGPQLLARETDEKSLSERRKERQQKPPGNPPAILTEKIYHDRAMTDLGGNVKVGWVCGVCGKTDVMESNHPMTQLIDAAKGKGFKEVEAKLEILGERYLHWGRFF